MVRHRHGEIHPAYLITIAILCMVSLVSCLWFFIEKTKVYQELSQKIEGLSQENAVLSSKIEKAEGEKFNLSLQISQLEEKIKEFTAERESFSLKLDSLAKENKNLSSLMQDLSQEKLALEDKIKELKVKSFVAGPGTQLDEIIQAKVKMEEALKSERQLSEALSSELLQERQERLLAKAEKEELKVRLSAKSKELEAMSTALEQIPVLSRGPSAVQLPPVIVRADEKIEWLARKVRGEIISVDKERNFVIINLGEEDGISPGQIFKIVREDKDVARLKVIQTRKTISACDVQEVTAGFSIQKDDEVVLVP